VNNCSEVLQAVALATTHNLHIRHLGLRDYAEVYGEMRDWTDARDESSVDELWLLQHPPVYTLGQAGRPEDILSAQGVEVVRTDRGGQVTYHGPGQLVAYIMMDLQRRRWGVRQLVCSLEQSVIDLCAGYGINAQRRERAPGIYVDGRKLAALGLRVRHGRSYHGLALNVDLDLGPFTRINPCGYEGLEVTRLSDLGVHDGLAGVQGVLVEQLLANLEYNAVHTDGRE